MKIPRKPMMRTLMIATTSVSAAILFSSAASTQESRQGTSSIPDFSGIWAHPSIPGFEPPALGPGPVVNKSRIRNGPQKGRSAFNQSVGDYTNPILKPHAAEVVKQHSDIELSGATSPTPRNQCWPEGVPFVFANMGMQLLQQPDKITILYDYGHQVRHVRMNQPDVTQLTPSWYGDSVGHYEGDTVVIDTVGIKIGPFSMIDWYGTPYTGALHVVERYRLLDYETAKEGLERDAKENFDLDLAPVREARLRIDRNYKGKHLQLEFTVDDEGAFTTPWSATITYRPGFSWLGAAEWPEVVCAENILFSSGKDAAVPHADRPDF